MPDGIHRKLVSDEGALQWFTMDEVGDLEMPSSARFAMNHYLKEGRFDKMLYGGVVNGENAVFTPMPEM